MDIRLLVTTAVPRAFPGACRIYNLTGSSAALLLALLERPFVAVEHDEARAAALAGDINFFRGIFSARKVLFLPDANGAGAAGRRAEIICSLEDDDSLVTSSGNLLSPLGERKALEEKMAFLKKGAVIGRGELEKILAGLGYVRAPMVAENGEYGRREWIIDIFPSTSDVPLRVEFFGDEIEHLRLFDTGTQRSTAEVAEFVILPAAEPGGPRPLADAMGERSFFCLYPAKEKDGLPENTVYLSGYSFVGAAFHNGDEEGGSPSLPQIDSGMLSVKGMGILPEERKGLDGLAGSLKAVLAHNKVIMVASSAGQSERVRDLLREKDMIVPVLGAGEVLDYGGDILITVGTLSSGVFAEGLMILTERELFGERPAFRPMRKSKAADLLKSVDDITPGDFVVHRDHGIGRFSGVVRRKKDDAELELMLIEYEDGRLYIPVHLIRNVSKYRSEEGVVPKVDRLGGKTWQRKKEKVRKRVRELAERLLALYAGRKTARGFTFSPDTELHREFDSFFAYEETADQLKAIEDIKKDMESDIPMDRLLCGDVGYGKTEVAMRAAFKAVYDNRQVAVLVPTTILAEQHYRTFRERFSGFPIVTDFISRFKSKKDAEKTIRGLSRGEVDIVIGTHAILSGKIRFGRLGLLVIDEEHRFGVGQKEKIKEMSRGIDVLTLTATPIPRTLHMALSGIRNISVIETPPEERLSVKSAVSVFNDGLIRGAITAELERDGQVYFVHNRISDIFRMARRIRELVPAAVIGTAHGRMPERELEEVMHRFFEGEINVLVSTAIVGSGLDIPRANTIIINMADKMGLADLYQLRGRAGRSNVKGYAYFLAPPESLLTAEARKRLQAVQEMSYLGAGFRLALKDLEIRGAGEIFGAEQSGHIHDIGFDLYIEMLEKAVSELKGAEVKEQAEPVIELKTAAFIPEEYIADVTLRLSFYRRIAFFNDEKDVADFDVELRDRFGSPPEEVINLLKIVLLKVLARRLAVSRIHESGGKVRVAFFPDTPVVPASVFDLHKKRKGTIRFFPDGFELDLKGAGRDEVHEKVRSVLEELCGKTDACAAVQ